MMTMEAELRALRDELQTRNKPQQPHQQPSSIPPPPPPPSTASEATSIRSNGKRELDEDLDEAVEEADVKAPPENGCKKLKTEQSSEEAVKATSDSATTATASE